jgi:hypothetical protein
MGTGRASRLGTAHDEENQTYPLFLLQGFESDTADEPQTVRLGSHGRGLMFLPSYQPNAAAQARRRTDTTFQLKHDRS